MATAPVTVEQPVGTTITAARAENKFETFLTTAAKDVVKFNNALINIVNAEQPLLNQVLPPQYAQVEIAVNTLFKNTMLEVEAGYATINPTATFADKVARVVAITAPAAIQLLASIGVTAGQSELTALATGANSFAALQTSGITTLTPTPSA